METYETVGDVTGYGRRQEGGAVRQGVNDGQVQHLRVVVACNKGRVRVIGVALVWWPKTSTGFTYINYKDHLEFVLSDGVTNSQR